MTAGKSTCQPSGTRTPNRPASRTVPPRGRIGGEPSTARTRRSNSRRRACPVRPGRPSHPDRPQQRVRRFHSRSRPGCISWPVQGSPSAGVSDQSRVVGVTGDGSDGHGKSFRVG
jgi:hypothetical protein